MAIGCPLLASNSKETIYATTTDMAQDRSWARHTAACQRSKCPGPDLGGACAAPRDPDTAVDKNISSSQGTSDCAINLKMRQTNRHATEDDSNIGSLLTPIFLENLTVGFGLASGGDDPRSTNQTFTDSFSHKGIRIDLAFAEYRPAPWLALIGGKFKNPLWIPSDWLWDSDIRPEGGAYLSITKFSPASSSFWFPGYGL